jgi:hypothetical protein
MARVTPQEYAEKWKRRLSSATEDIRKGVQKVTQAPGQAAVANTEGMRRNINEAIDSGRWARKTAAVTVDQWKTAALEKGLARIPTGAQQAEQKMARVATTLLPAVDAAAAAARAMPKVTIEDSIARVGEFVRRMHAFKTGA